MKYSKYIEKNKDTSKDPELFGIENGHLLNNPEEEDIGLSVTHLPDEAGDSNNFDMDVDDNNNAVDDLLDAEADAATENHYALPTKRHIGAVYRSGFLPSYRALRSTTGSGVGGGRFSRSGRARQFV